MQWSFWFAKKWRGISLCLLGTLLLIGTLIAQWLGNAQMQRQRQLTDSAWRQAVQQHQLAEQQYQRWQAKKTQLQAGLPYIVTKDTPELSALLQHWQQTQPQRKLRFELESVEALPRGYETHTQSVPRAVQKVWLRFWAQDEEDLSQAWTEKKALPCLFVIRSAQLARAEEGGIWAEEDALCVQF